ncbi:hypothetical protein IFR05_016465 [Cadophora sp. M221]|nr:hypothetical protein IFR05_016465 [Cadophora sp. M221]
MVRFQSRFHAVHVEKDSLDVATLHDMADRIHSGVRPHVCDHPGCGKRFIQKSALTVHNRVHTGEKPHMCERCGKPFADSSSLARHRRIHSGKRPYKCPYADCQKTFTRRTTLTRHQNHHSGTVEEAAVATAAALATRQSSNQHGQNLWSYGTPPSSNDSTPRLDKSNLLDSRITYSNEARHTAPDARWSYRASSQQLFP